MKTEKSGTKKIKSVENFDVLGHFGRRDIVGETDGPFLSLVFFFILFRVFFIMGGIWE